MSTSKLVGGGIADIPGAPECKTELKHNFLLSEMRSTVANKIVDLERM